MAQYFTQERSLAAASPQIVDDTDRLVKEANEALSRLQAVQDYETKQKGNLITNLRSIREYEKGLNTRNHQMMMQNVKQIADIQQRDDRIIQQNKQLAAREKAAQEQRTMKAIGGIIQGVGQAYQGAVQMAEEQVQKASEEQIANQKAEQEEKIVSAITVPQQNEGAAFGTEEQVKTVEQVQLAKDTEAKVAKMQGLELPNWVGLFLSKSRIERIQRTAHVSQLSTDITQGGWLYRTMQNEPDTPLEYQNHLTGETIKTTYGEFIKRQPQSPEELNYVLTQVAKNELVKRIGPSDVNLHHEEFAKIRGFINQQVEAFANRQAQGILEDFASLKLQSILDAPDLGKATSKYIDEAIADPSLTRVQAQDNVLGLVKHVPPGQLEEYNNYIQNSDKFGTLFKQQFLEKVQAARDQYSANYQRNALNKAVDYAQKAFFLTQKDGFTSPLETKAVIDQVQKLQLKGELTDYEAYLTRNELFKLVKGDANAKLAKEEWQDRLDSLKLTTEENDAARAAGFINAAEHNEGNEMIAEKNAINIEGEQYSEKTVKSTIDVEVNNQIGVNKLSGQPIHSSAQPVKALAYDLYTNRLKRYYNQTDENGVRLYTMQAAHDKAFADVLAELQRGEGVFHVNSSDSTIGPFFSRFTPGTHPGAPKFPSGATTPASDLGESLVGVQGLEKLKTTAYPDLEQDYAHIKARAELGLPFKPSEYFETTGSISGHSPSDMFNAIAEFKGDTVRVKKESPLEVLRTQTQDISELKRNLTEITLPKLQSTALFLGMGPHTTGSGPRAYQVMQGIGNKLFNDANASKVAEAWYNHTKGGQNPMQGSPTEQYMEISEMYDIPMETQTVLVAQANFTGGSATIRDLQSKNQPRDPGGLVSLIMTGESSNQLLIYNRGTTRDIGYFPANATFGSVEKAQSEGKAFAAGGSQMTPGVLNQGRVAAGIPDDAPFNSLRNQTLSVLGLILNTNKRPALRDYLLGQSNDINAAHQDLAYEFAAIEAPSGRGAYDGDSAGNKANTKAAEVRRVLQQAREELKSNPIYFN